MVVVSSSFVHFDYLTEHLALVVFLRQDRDRHFGTKMLVPGAVITHLMSVNLICLTFSSFYLVLKDSLLFLELFIISASF